MRNEERKTDKMIELTNGHIRSNVLPHRQQRNPNDRERLMRIILLLRIQMVMTMIQHRLNFQNIPRAGVRADFDENESLFTEGCFDRFEGFDSRFRGILST